MQARKRAGSGASVLAITAAGADHRPTRRQQARTMSDTFESRPGMTYWIIAGVALVWNLIGIFMFYLQVTATPEALAEYYTDAEVAFIVNTPAWATGAYAIAVFAGALGCVLLLLRKALAIPAFIVSLVGILLQNFYSFALGDGIEIWGTSGMILPAIVILIAVGLIAFASSARRQGWLG